MNEQAAIANELNLIEAHFNEGLKRVAGLRKKLQPRSLGRSKNSKQKKGLSPTIQAKIIGRKRSNQTKKATALTVAR